MTPRYEWHEPLIFLSLVSQRPDTLPSEGRPPLEHRGQRPQLTAVRVAAPQVSPFSLGLRTLCNLNLLAVREATEHHLELDWDGGSSGEFHDFRPTVPLVLRW